MNPEAIKNRYLNNDNKKIIYENKSMYELVATFKERDRENGFSMNCEFYTNVFRKDVGMPKIIEKWYINGMRGLFQKKKKNL